MLVILCLNLESILHSKTHENIDFENEKKTLWNHMDTLQDEKTSRDLIMTCSECHETALDMIVSFNVKGSIIAFFLASFSFLFAFKLEVFLRYYIIFVPLSILTALTTVVFFIIAFMSKSSLPKECINLGIDRTCNSDFDYQMEYKIVPYSFLMLVLVPQFLARSAELFFVKFCLNKKTFMYESKYTRKKPRSIISDNSNHLDIYDSDHDLGFRELPVDCPSIIVSMDDKKKSANATQVDINNNERLKEDNECYKIPEYPEDDQSIPDITNKNFHSIKIPNQRIFAKSTSLSTIAEERTMNTHSISSVNKHRLSESDDSSMTDRVIIQKLLDDFQNKNTLINEIIHVFEPSSKMGNFNRNVPIRFSSPSKHFKEKGKENSQASLSLTSLCTTESTDNSPTNSNRSPLSENSEKNGNDILLKSIMSGNSEINIDSSKNTNWLGNMIIAKQIRLVKRLKNRIETKSGNKIHNSKNSSDIKPRNGSILKNTSNSPYNIRKNKIKSKRSLVFDSPAKSSEIFTLTSKNNELIDDSYDDLKYQLPKVDLNDNQLDNFNSNTDNIHIVKGVEPVYF